jgi:hypothetical protein
MDVHFATKLLDILVENGSRILAAGFGVNWAESSFFDAVRLLRQEEVLRPHFLERVRVTFAARSPEQLNPGMVPIELIELVAHELRWPELLELAKQRVGKFFGGDATLAIGDIARRLSEAYQENWQDREFYEHYRARSP